MLQISAEILALSGECAVLESMGKIVYANSGAQLLLGADCVGKTLANVFGDDLAGIQAPCFIGNFSIKGKQHIVRVCSMDGMRAIFISDRENDPALLNDAFVCSLRNSLMNLNTTMSLIHEAKDALKPALAELLAQINHDYFKLNRVLTNLSHIRDIWGNNQVFSPVYMDLAAHVRNTVESIRIMRPGVDIRFKAPEKLMLYADPFLLDTLLYNIISNCFTHAEGYTRISIALTELRDRVVLSVDDDGCGIAADKLHSVFDRYRHVMTLNEMKSGPGLGLTAARLIARLHGGILLLESRESMGTAVRVSLSTEQHMPIPANQPSRDYEQSMDGLLTGLAHCLPLECFSEKFIY